MKIKNKFGIKRKLFTSYLAFVLILLIIGIVGIHNLHTIYKNGSKIYTDSMTAIEYMTEIDKNVKEIDRCVLGMLSDFDKDYHKTYLERINISMNKISAMMECYESLDSPAIEKEKYDECKANVDLFVEKYSEIISYIDKGERDEAIIKCEQELAVVKASVYTSLEEVIDIEEERASVIEANNKKIYNNTIWKFSLVVIAGIMIAIAFAAYIGNYFSSKLNSIQMLARRLSEYNIADDINEMDNGEFGKTMMALNESQFMIRELMEKIIAESTTISETGEEISLAIRKSEQRVEDVNIKILEAFQKAKYMDSSISLLLGGNALDEETIHLLKAMSGESADICVSLEKSGTELAGIATYLEQIGISSDYQNEIANNHKEQVARFKVESK